VYTKFDYRHKDFTNRILKILPEKDDLIKKELVIAFFEAGMYRYAPWKWLNCNKMNVLTVKN
jgi:hypothetical protein